MARRKRTNGEGSIYQRTDGLWVASATVFEGMRLRRVVKYGRTATEAREKLTDLKSKQDAGQPIAFQAMTLRRWLDEWLKVYIDPQRSPKTAASYRALLGSHLDDATGRLPLAKVQPEAIQRRLNALCKAGKARTAEYLRAVLRAALNRAVKLRHCPMNPVAMTEPVRFDRREGATFTAEQAQRLMDCAREADDRLEGLYGLALSLGLRKGELTGLKPADIDLAAGTLRVERALQWLKRGKKRGEGEWVEVPPKQRSRRTLPLPKVALDAVRRQLARREAEAAARGKDWHNCGCLFTSPTGAPLHPASINIAWAAACKRAKVPRIRFHDARHSCGTLLHAMGASPFVIQTVLGHSQLSTTRRYTKVPEAVQRIALDKLGEALEMPVAKPEPRPVATGLLQ